MSDSSNVLYRANKLQVQKDAIMVGQTKYPILMVKSAAMESEEIPKDGLGFFLFGSVFLTLLGCYIIFYVVYLFIDSQNAVRDCADGMGADGCLGGMVERIEMVNYFISALALFLFWLARTFWKTYRLRTRLLKAGAKIHKIMITTPALTVPVYRTHKQDEAEEVLAVIKGAIGQG